MGIYINRFNFVEHLLQVGTNFIPQFLDFATDKSNKCAEADVYLPTEIQT
jgi:hypothetical protein